MMQPSTGGTPRPRTRLRTSQSSPSAPSLPCDLGGLGIHRFEGLAREIACLWGRTVL